MTIDRRTLLGGLATAGLWGGARPSAGADSVAKRTLRVAFLTDSHLPVSPGENARMSRMLDRVLGQHARRKARKDRSRGAGSSPTTGSRG